MDVVFSIIIALLLIIGLISFIKWSYVFIFMQGNPLLWIFIMGAFNFVYFLVGSKWENHSETIWWSSFLAFAACLPRSQKPVTRHSFFEIFRDVPEIENCRLKQSLGLLSWAIGGGLGWILFFRLS